MNQNDHNDRFACLRLTPSGKGATREPNIVIVPDNRLGAVYVVRRMAADELLSCTTTAHAFTIFIIVSGRGTIAGNDLPPREFIAGDIILLPNNALFDIFAITELVFKQYVISDRDLS